MDLIKVVINEFCCDLEGMNFIEVEHNVLVVK